MQLPPPQSMEIFKDGKEKETMEQIRQTHKKYCSIAITFAIFAAIGFFLLSLQPVGKGLLLGTLFSIVNFILIGETLPARIGKSKNRTMMIAVTSIMIRYVLLAFPLFISIKFEQYNLAATICGLFMVQFMILADHVIHLIFPSTNQKNGIPNLTWKN